MIFKVPKTLKEDFDDFLLTSVCSDVYYCSDICTASPIWVCDRAEITPINFKSKFAGSDNTVKIKFSCDSGINKGDYILYNNQIYLCSWQIIDTEPNCKTTQMILCTAQISFQQYQEDIVDPTSGRILTHGGYYIILPDLRCVVSTKGNYEYRYSTGKVGILPNNYLTLNVQANIETLKLKIGDIFQFYNEWYEIIDIGYSEMNYDGNSGIISLVCDKSANIGVPVN